MLNEHTMVKVIHIYILLLLSSLTASAAEVSIDRDWYLAGEAMHISIDINDRVSRVVYAELSDRQGIKAGAVLSLSDGKAQGTMILPGLLHSGMYQLAVYTRTIKPHLLNVAVVNTLSASADDDIEWEASAETQAATMPQPYCGKTAKQALSVVANGRLLTHLQASKAMSTEAIGHVVTVKLKRSAADVTALLSVVGKQINIFGGKQVNDSIIQFQTYGLKGKHQIVITAYDKLRNPLPLEIVSPYLGYTPDSLPQLKLHYSRQEVEARSIAMQQASLEHKDTVMPLPYSNEVFSCKPMLHYNLDEYRQFRTIGDTFVEYVNYVRRDNYNGFNELFVYSDTEGYSEWGALTIIDGVPTFDIDRLLRYDARRIEHINIYKERINLGVNNMYKGIVSFVTRSGDITNFPPDNGSAYVIYEFPR